MIEWCEWVVGWRDGSTTMREMYVRPRSAARRAECANESHRRSEITASGTLETTSARYPIVTRFVMHNTVYNGVHLQAAHAIVFTRGLDDREGRA